MTLMGLLNKCQYLSIKKLLSGKHGCLFKKKKNYELYGNQLNIIIG